MRDFVPVLKRWAVYGSLVAFAAVKFYFLKQHRGSVGGLSIVVNLYKLS